METIWYSALFLTDPQKLIADFPPKHEKVFAHHSTIAFKPESADGLEMGKQWKIKVLGRAFDDKGDALLVENPKSKNEFPHITLSCTLDTDPIYSNELLKRAVTEKTITYFDEPYYVDAVEGYETIDKKVIPQGINPFNHTPGK